jgi:vacuolar-type H+-ATPase subunit I/STV1
MPNESLNSGWESYSRLVLQQLESLSKGIDALRDELQDVKQQLAELKVKEDKVQELKEWKGKMDEVISPTQLKTALVELDDLKLYKTKAITVFAVVQFMMATALALSQFY